jgi:ureidoacrylate peracid hydrolase
MTNTKLVTINAKPEPLAIDLAKTAVLVIDMQNDFAAVGGMFERSGIDISAIRETIEPTGRVLAAARSRKVPVIYIAEALSPDLSDVGPSHSPHGLMAERMRVGQADTAPDGRQSRIHIEGTWHTQVIAELAQWLPAYRRREHPSPVRRCCSDVPDPSHYLSLRA